jgi:hypothetical protein
VVKKLVLGAVPALMMMSAPALAQAPAWMVSEVSGRVQLMENGHSRTATRGALLSSGATITTAASSRAVIVRGQEFVVISPGTRIRVPEASGASSIMQMIADYGSALFRIEKKSTPHFGVQTPYLAAVVKGTTFTVTVGPEGGKVRVTEGAVEVSTLDGGASDLVTPGIVAMVGANDRYTLTVEGKETKILRSGKAPALAGTVTAKSSPNVASLLKGDNRSERAVAVRIAKAIREKPVSLEKATGGLLKGNSASDHAQAEFNDHSRRAIKGMKPGKDDKPKNDQPGKDEKPEKDTPKNPKEGGGKPGDGGDGKPGGGDGGKPGGGDGKPGGDAPGKDDGGKPGGDAPGKDDGGKPGGDAPGKDDGGKPGGDAPGKGDGGKPGGDNPGKDDGGKSEDKGKPDEDDGGKPGKDDDSGPGKPGKDDDSGLDKDDNSKPGSDDDGDGPDN